MIRHGESVKTVQKRLGHSSAAITLDTYTHLWPDSDDRTREAVEQALGAKSDSAADTVRTARAGSTVPTGGTSASAACTATDVLHDGASATLAAVTTQHSG